MKLTTEELLRLREAELDILKEQIHELEEEILALRDEVERLRGLLAEVLPCLDALPDVLPQELDWYDMDDGKGIDERIRATLAETPRTREKNNEGL